MMKKYNKPEIVALALETVDVIETSGGTYGANAVAAMGGDYATYAVQAVEDDINNMATGKWTW